MICCLFKNRQLFPHQMEFQKQWSGFVFQDYIFLSSVGKDGKDGRGLKNLKKLAVLMLCLQKIFLWLLLPDEIV